MRRSILFPSRFQTIPQITTQSLPSANQNQPYSFQFTEAGGTYPFTWSATITPNSGGRFTLDPVTGILSGTQTVVETETVTVQVSDAMTPHNVAQATFTLPVNSGVVVTTSSLPTGTAGTSYVTTLSASGGTPPYTWGMSPTNLDGLTLSTSGVLSGTPTSATTVSGTFTATDSLGIPSAPVSLSFTATVASGTLGPQRMFRGSMSSTEVRFTWWPPSDGTEPDGYNIYRLDVGTAAGQQLNGATPITRKYFGGGGPTAPSIKYPLYIDTTLSPGTNYSYYVKSIYGGVESAPGPTISITTLGATGWTPPTPVTDPATYVPAYSLPTGTRWTATQNTGAATNNAGTGTLGNVGCGFGFALNNAQPGDVIVLSSGLTYTSAAAGGQFAVNVSTPNLYIISDQDPGYNPSGTLPAYTTSTSVRYQSYTATGTIALGAQSLTLTANYTGRTGWYTTVFASGNPSGIESRQALFQKNSATVVWNVGLQAACSANFVSSAGNAIHVSPWDAGIPIGAGNVTNPTPSMPIIQFNTAAAAQGNGVNVQATNVRLVGICVQPIPSGTTGLTACVNLSGVAGTGAVLDRCVVGRDNTVATRSLFGRAVSTNAPNGVVHQCYLYGADFGPNGGDTQAVLIAGNGPHCIENNYMESVSEICISGGSFVPEDHVQHDITIRYNYCHKQTAWQQLTTAGSTFSISRRVKNHLELKTGVRFEYHNNIIQNNAQLQASQGQGARAFVMTPRDQIGQPNGTWNITSLTWSAATGLASATVVFNLPANSFFTTTIANASPAGFEGTYVCQVNSTATGFTYAIPNPGATTATFLVDSPTPPGPPSSITMLKPSQAGGMWQNITDGNIHDNQIYGVGSSWYIVSNDDYNPTLHSERIWVHNNLSWINPAFTDDQSFLTPQRGFEFLGQTPDVKIDNNTIIMSPQAHGYAANSIVYGIVSYQTGTTNTFVDRWTITDNIFDGGTGAAIINYAAVSPPHVNADGGTFVQFSFNTSNLVWNKNLFILDTSTGANAWPGGSPTGPNTYNPIAYSNVGFSNFISNVTMPSDPSQWNVTNGTFATASTTGGPIGASFTSPQLQFPLLGAVLVGGNVDFVNIPHVGAMQFAQFTCYPGYNVGGKSFSQQIDAVLALNPAMKIMPQGNIMEATRGDAAHAAQYNKDANGATPEDWFLFDNYTTRGTWNGTAWTGNVPVVSQAGKDSVNLTSPSLTTVADAFAPVGSTYATWQAGWFKSFMITSATGGNPKVGGIHTDNWFFQPRVNGDYLRNGTSQSAATIAQNWRDGYVAYAAALRTAMGAGYLVTGNVADWANGAITGYSGLLNGGLFEGAFGTTFGGSEGAAGGWATFMASYKLMMNAMVPLNGQGPYLVIQTQVASTNFAGARYALCSTFLDNGYFAFSAGGNYSTFAWTDEMAFNLGLPIAGPNNLNNGTFSSGGLLVWQNGVWRRDFQNGIVLVNPRGNGAKTVTLEVDVWHLRQVVDTDGVNNAAKVTAGTAISMPDAGVAGTGGSGLILSRTPT